MTKILKFHALAAALPCIFSKPVLETDDGQPKESVSPCPAGYHIPQISQTLNITEFIQKGQPGKNLGPQLCQNWSHNSPNLVKDKLFPDGDKPDDNFCRNPDNDPNGPWCYFAEHTNLWMQHLNKTSNEWIPSRRNYFYCFEDWEIEACEKDSLELIESEASTTEASPLMAGDEFVALNDKFDPTSGDDDDDFGDYDNYLDGDATEIDNADLDKVGVENFTCDDDCLSYWVEGVKSFLNDHDVEDKLTSHKWQCTDPKTWDNWKILKICEESKQVSGGFPTFGAELFAISNDHKDCNSQIVFSGAEVERTGVIVTDYTDFEVSFIGDDEFVCVGEEQAFTEKTPEGSGSGKEVDNGEDPDYPDYF